MPNVCADLLNGILEFASKSPLLACLMLLVLGAGTLLVGIFIFRIISRNCLAWLAAFAQSVPLAMPVFYANFLLENWGNYAIWVIVVIYLIFFVLATQVNQFMRELHTGGSSNGRLVIITLGFVGMFFWTVILGRIFLDFPEFPVFPVSSSQPPVSGGRP